MVRPPLVLETWGKISRGTNAKGVAFASARYRDSDGRTRQMMRTGPTKAAAERTLIEALKKRVAPEPGEIGRDSSVRDLHAAWWAEMEAQPDRWADGTWRAYERASRFVLDGMGEVRIGEVSVPRLDRLVKAITEARGRVAGSHARSILNGMFGLAARHGALGALGVNPVLSTAKVPKTKKAVTAPDGIIVRDVLALLRAHDQRRIRGKQLADLEDFALVLAGLSGRPGEVLALRYSRLLELPRVHVAATVAQNRAGKWGIQEQPKTSTSNAVVTLPPSAVAVIERRRAEALSDLVFPSSTGTVTVPQNLRTRWNEALKGSPHAGLTPKAFRKAVATWIAEQEGMEAARKQLRHGANSTVAEAAYIDKMRNAADYSATLERLLRPRAVEPAASASAAS